MENSIFLQEKKAFVSFNGVHQRFTPWVIGFYKKKTVIAIKTVRGFHVKHNEY